MIGLIVQIIFAADLLRPTYYKYLGTYFRNYTWISREEPADVLIRARVYLE